MSFIEKYVLLFLKCVVLHRDKVDLRCLKQKKKLIFREFYLIIKIKLKNYKKKYSTKFSVS